MTECFQTGDRVVAIDADTSRFIRPGKLRSHPCLFFPDGELRTGAIYRIRAIEPVSDGTQGILLAEIRAIAGPHEIRWHPSRFRKMPPGQSQKEDPGKA